MDQQNDLTTHKDVREFYDNIYYDHEAAVHPSSRHYRRLANRLKLTGNQHILDIACGKGEWLSAVAPKCRGLTGVDISIKALTQCKDFLPNRLFCCAAAEKLPLISDHYDVVSCLGALEHFLNPEQALREIVRVGKPGSQILLLVPNSDFLTAKLGLYKGTSQTGIKEDVRTIDEWEQLFNDAGLTVEKKWRDLHVLSWNWISKGKWYALPFRAFQAILLAIWPLKWQYQVYFLCRNSTT